MTVFGGNCFDIVSENIVIVIKTWREGKITITMDLTIRNYIAVRPGLNYLPCSRLLTPYARISHYF